MEVEAITNSETIRDFDCDIDRDFSLSDHEFQSGKYSMLISENFKESLTDCAEGFKKTVFTQIIFPIHTQMVF